MRTLFGVFLLAIAAWGAPLLTDADFLAAQQKGKITLYLYTAVGCPECRYMKQKVFHDPAIAPLLARDFVVVERDVNIDTLIDGFDYFGIPTLFLVAPDGTLIEKVVGSRKAPLFAPILRNAQKVLR